MMQTWLVVCLALFIIGVVNADKAEVSVKKDHNGDPYKALCNLLKIAVYDFVNKGDTLSDTLKAALNKTIFGSESGGTLEALKDLPADYTEGGAIRANSCGQPYEDPTFYSAPPRWSGHSAPHNLVCLCTKGENGYPVNNSANQDTLCGKTRETLGSGNEGWTDSKTGQAQMEATWKNVVSECLEGGGQAEDLKTALKELKDKMGPLVTHDPPYQLLGEGKVINYEACSGSALRGVCVAYYPKDKNAKTWWVQLDEALIKDAEIQKQKKIADEEAQQKKKLEKSEKTETGSLTSTTASEPEPKTEETNSHNVSKIIEMVQRTSGTPISMPTTWLLRALLLI